MSRPRRVPARGDLTLPVPIPFGDYQDLGGRLTAAGQAVQQTTYRLLKAARQVDDGPSAAEARCDQALIAGLQADGWTVMITPNTRRGGY